MRNASGITLDIVLTWLRRHRPASSFQASEISNALGFTLKDVPQRQAVVGRCTTLLHQGLLTNLTPDKARHRIYRLTPAALATPARVRFDEAAPRDRTQDRAEPAATSVVARLDRIERLLARFATEWGITV